jgi:hypothetical protein
MKQLIRLRIKTLASFLTLMWLYELAPAAPLGTAFTFNGRLSDGGSPATGNYDFQFALYDADTGGSLVGTPTTIALAPVGVTNGLFNVALDFGGAAFAGDARWLQIEVRPNGSGSPHTVLSPRQLLTLTPYSLYSIKAGLATSADTASGVAPLGVVTPMLADGAVTTGKLNDGAVTSSKIGGGQVVKTINALKDDINVVGGLNVTVSTTPGTIQISSTAGSSGWGLAGNGGTTGSDFLGTTDTQPLNLRVNGGRALRLEPNGTSPNLIGGYQDNAVLAGLAGATIGGGGQLGLANFVIGDFGTIGGGVENTAGNLAVVGAGQHNRASGVRASVSGGGFNIASGDAATIPGGTYNTAAGENSFAAGQQAQAIHDGSFVWADRAFADFSSTAVNQFLIRASGGVGIGTDRPTKALDVRDGSGSGGQGGSIHVGGTGANGDPKIINFGDGDFVHIGEKGADDRMELKAETFHFTSSSGNLRVGVGTDTPLAELDVRGTARVGVLTITGGADVAEPFQMSTHGIPKGSLVVIDENRPGQLKLSEHAYDRHAAGIVSGANGIKPGLTLHQEGAIHGDANVALSGRVYALADAANGSIQPGDLLTTSDIPGHAMKVTDYTKAQGAIIGKAMSSLEKGRGMVLVLVSLQ